MIQTFRSTHASTVQSNTGGTAWIFSFVFMERLQLPQLINLLLMQSMAEKHTVIPSSQTATQWLYYHRVAWTSPKYGFDLKGNKTKSWVIPPGLCDISKRYRRSYELIWVQACHFPCKRAENADFPAVITPKVLDKYIGCPWNAFFSIFKHHTLVIRTVP